MNALISRFFPANIPNEKVRNNSIHLKKYFYLFTDRRKGKEWKGRNSKLCWNPHTCKNGNEEEEWGKQRGQTAVGFDIYPPFQHLINLLCNGPRYSENSLSGGNVDQWDGDTSNSREWLGKTWYLANLLPELQDWRNMKWQNAYFNSHLKLKCL